MTLFARSFHEQGPGKPLVLLHGFGGAGVQWDPIVEALPEQPMLVYDLPGHAASLDDPGAGSAGRMAKSIAADLSSRGITQFHLCGHSLGGAVVALLALRAPAQIASLTLVAPGGFGPEIDGETLTRLATAADASTLQEAYRRLLANGGEPRAGLLEHLLRTARTPRHCAQLLSILSGFLQVSKDGFAQGVLPLAELDALSCPKALLWGRQDPMLPFAQAAGVTTFKTRAIDGAGHMLMEEAPEAVVAVLRDQIAEDTLRARSSSLASEDGPDTT